MNNILSDLNGKTILVAGASSGIGAATTEYLATCGCKLVLVARRLEKLNEVKEKLSGVEHSVYSFDFSDLDSIEFLVNQIVNDNGQLDGMVFSVGQPVTRPLKVLKPDFMLNAMKINFLSFIELTRCCTNKKNANPDSFSVVAVSSLSSMQGNQAKTAYSATKGALDASIRCLAKEFAARNMRFNTVNPAWVKTDIFENHIANVGESEDFKEVLNRQYLGMIEPLDIAKTIAFLLSNSSHYITGQNIPVDGGRLSS